MYSIQKKYTFIAALLMSFITGGALFGMEAKTSSLAIFKELPLELKRSIVFKWLETILGYNYTTHTLSIPERFLNSNCHSLVPTCDPNLVLIGRRCDVLLYNIRTGKIKKEFKEFKTEKSIQQIAVNGDKTKVALLQGKEICLWDLSTEEKSIVFKADEELHSVDLSTDGKYILVGGTQVVTENTAKGTQDIYLFDISTKKLVKKFKVATESTHVCSAIFNRKSNKILTATVSGEVIIWDLQGNKLTTCVTVNMFLKHALFSPDERSIIAAGQHGITIFDAHTGNIRVTNSDIGNISSLACSPDGNTLIAGAPGDTKVYVIDLKTAKVLTTLKNVGTLGIDSYRIPMCFTSDGNNIVSASQRGKLCLHSRCLNQEDNAWIHTRKEAALELFLQLQGKQQQEELSVSTVQQLQNIPKGKAFLIFAILAMILGYNL